MKPAVFTKAVPTLILLMINMLGAPQVAKPPAETAQPTAKAKTTTAPKPSEISAAVCRSGPTNKTFTVIVWEAGTWRRNSTRVLSWQDQTDIVEFGGTKHMTMAQLIGGTPFDKDTRSLADLKGERVNFFLERIGDKEVIRKMEIGIARFAHEVSIAVPSANIIDQINQAAKPTKVQCDDGK